MGFDSNWVTPMKKSLLLILSTLSNMAAVYFAYPFYISYVGGRFIHYSYFSGGDLTRAVDITGFRVWASLFSIIGIGLGIIALILARLCKKEGLLQVWNIGRICPLYSLTLLVILVALLWIEFTYYIGEDGVTVKMGLLFVTGLI